MTTRPSGWSPEPGDENAPVDESVQADHSPREPLSDVLRRLIENARAYAEAESQRQKLRASFIASNLRDAAIAGILALFLLFAVIVALLIGLIVALAPVVGIWWALVIVIAGGLLAVAALSLFAAARVKRLKRKDRA